MDQACIPLFLFDQCLVCKTYVCPPDEPFLLNPVYLCQINDLTAQLASEGTLAGFSFLLQSDYDSSLCGVGLFYQKLSDIQGSMTGAQAQVLTNVYTFVEVHGIIVILHFTHI